MCDDCTDMVIAEASTYENALWEIADLHYSKYPTDKMKYCDRCGGFWPCLTFATALEAINREY